MREQETVVIVGNGGREHSVGWKLKQSPNEPRLLFAPGNAGTAQIGHGATVLKNGIAETNGGRVVDIVAYGKNRSDARRKANSYIGEEGVHFEGMHYRKDIGT